MEFMGEKGQDRWVVEEVFRGRRNGTFVDLAATDGVAANNTLVLERDLGWTGLCIEPNPQSFAALVRNRTCQVSDACIDERYGEVEFFPNAGLGGIIASDTDNSPLVRSEQLAAARRDGQTLRLQARPLADVLDAHGLPSNRLPKLGC